MLDALLGCKQLRHGLSGRAMLMRGRSLVGQSSRYLAMMTRPVLTKPFKAWSMIVILIPVYDILIHCNPVIRLPQIDMHWSIELLINLHNDRHLFAEAFVTLSPIAMTFGWDKESVSSLKFTKFHLNPSNFNRKLAMMFKLDLKKNYANRIWNPGAEWVNAKNQFFLHRKWKLGRILCTHQKS